MRCAVVALLISSAITAQASTNSLYQELLEHGVPIGNGVRIRLPAPSFDDRLDSVQQQAVLRQIVGDRYPLDEFARDAVVAPMVLTFRDAGQGNVPARGVDLWFVAYGNLADLTDENLFEQFSLARGSGTSIYELTDDDLKQRGIARKAPTERFVHSKVTILDRVELTQTSQCLLSRTANSVIVASLIDERFAADANFPNAFSLLKRADAGELLKAPAKTYVGAGGYLKATRLLEPPGAIVIEYHLVYTEPHEWFSGANLLRSKLPMFLQSRVRALRRDLRERSQ